jgi:hypothetical protein
MTTEADLEAVLRTASAHCRPGGAALFVPDFVRETFEEGVDHGGGDSERGSVRFLQWISDPDPSDTTYVVDFAILVRDRKGRTRAVHDRHVQGLFPTARWLRLLRHAGFKPAVVKDSRVRDSFLARKPPANTVRQSGLSRDMRLGS